MIARMHHLVLDCPDPGALAEFYSALLGKPITYRSRRLRGGCRQRHASSGLAFQLAPDHQPPDWPDPHRPQQLHLDLMVNDPAAARDWVIGLGARPLTGQDGADSVYADPAGPPVLPDPQAVLGRRAGRTERCFASRSWNRRIAPEHRQRDPDGGRHRLRAAPDRPAGLRTVRCQAAPGRPGLPRPGLGHRARRPGQRLGRRCCRPGCSPSPPRRRPATPRSRYQPGDVLLFGTEPTGLPAAVLADHRLTGQVRIPMLAGRRSMNLSNTAAVAAYEAWRQHDFAGGR